MGGNGSLSEIEGNLSKSKKNSYHSSTEKKLL